MPLGAGTAMLLKQRCGGKKVLKLNNVPNVLYFCYNTTINTEHRHKVYKVYKIHKVPKRQLFPKHISFNIKYGFLPTFWLLCQF